MTTADEMLNEDPMFTRAKWRMHITQDARTPGYDAWVQLMKSFLEYFPEPQSKISSSPSEEERWSVIPIEAGTPPNSQRFGLLMRD